MNPKLPLDERIYTPTVGSVLTTNVSQTYLYVLAFAQTYSQTQAKLMLVTTLEMDNFDCAKMNARFQKFTGCLREGLIHEWKHSGELRPGSVFSARAPRLRRHAACGFAVSVLIT